MMKYILSFGSFVILSGCHDGSRCPKEWRNYKYADHAKVVAGFYKGQTGQIIELTWTYDNSSECDVPSFVVKLDSTQEMVRISQYDLFVE